MTQTAYIPDDADRMNSADQPCKQCRGLGHYAGHVQWSDGLGGVDMCCQRCNETGVEPTVDALLAERKELRRRLYETRHPVFIMVRNLIRCAVFERQNGREYTEAENCEGLSLGWQLLSDSERERMTKQTGYRMRFNGWNHWHLECVEVA